MLVHVFRGLASLQLAVSLLAGLAAVLACATLLEADKGREFAQWYVYGSPWFVGLLALLGLNILAATLIRFPWKKQHAGFVVTHAGLLVLLVGSIQTFLCGIEGQLTLHEGDRADSVLVNERSLITARRQSKRGGVSSDFFFQPGPVDWQEGRSLDFGVSDDFGLRVLKYYRHAQETTGWVSDETDYEGPALKLVLFGPSGHPVAEDWLIGNAFGGQAVIEATKYDLLPIPMQSMLQDFLEPPAGDLGTGGVLSIHYQGHMQRVRVDEYIGQKIVLGQSGMAVEIVEYLPNARPTPNGRFVSRGEQPDNPLLELKIHLPGAKQPVRQIALAKLPLLNLDAVHGRQYPVKFWYHHVGVPPAPGAVFLQTPDGNLYCRAMVGDSYQPAVEAKEGDRVQLGSDFSVTVAKHIPFARKEVAFQPVELGPGESDGPEAAALVEVIAGTDKRQLWLKRHDQQFGMQRIFTGQGPVELSFDYEQLPLGFSLEMKELTRRLNPGRVGNAAFVSSVRLVDAAGAVDRQHEISMNEPLVYGKFTFYQSSFQKLPGGMESSVLTAAYDPGRFLKYVGSLMICVGIFFMLSIRSYMFKSVRSRTRESSGPEVSRLLLQD